MTKKSRAKKNKGKYTLVCPKCGSTKVHSDLTKDMIVWGGSTRSVCEACNYSSTLFPEIDNSELNKFRKNIKQRTKEQEKVINEPIVSKGITNKKVNYWIALFYVGGILISITVTILEGILNDNSPILFAGILLFLIFLILGINSMRK